MLYASVTLEIFFHYYRQNPSRHLFLSGRRYFLEDLGSANGTYLNDVKLEPHTLVLLNEDAQFLIFPHQFSFSNRQVWQRQDAIRVAGGAPRVIFGIVEALLQAGHYVLVMAPEELSAT